MSNRRHSSRVPSRAALERRNRDLAARKHARSPKEKVRGLLLRLLVRLPIRETRGDGRTVLLIRPDHLGDVLLTAPAVEALAEARPEVRLVALVGPWAAEVISAYPQIDLTLTLPFPGFARHPTRPSARPYRLAWHWARQLRQLRAETAIVFRPDHWWGALLARWAGVPERVGFALPDVAPFLSRALPFSDGHAVEHNLALVEPWTGKLDPRGVRVRFPVDDLDRQEVAALLAERGFLAGAPRVIVHPGSGTPIKLWDAAGWARVADHLAGMWGAPILFTGGDHERLLIQAIRGRMAAPAISLAGETNVRQLAALYEGARVVLGPDSGPLHVAAAVGTPTVHLYGPADPQEFGPWGDSERHAVLTSDLACRPCRVLDWPDDDPANHPCVRDITPEAVIAAARRVTGGEA